MCLIPLIPVGLCLFFVLWGTELNIFEFYIAGLINQAIWKLTTFGYKHCDFSVKISQRPNLEIIQTIKE